MPADPHDLEEAAWHLARAEERQERGDFDDALEEFRAAGELGEPEGWHDAGLLLRWLGRFDEAVPLWQAAAEAGFTEPEDVASLLADAGRYDEAVAILERVADEGDASALVEIGAMEQERGDIEAAEVALRRALEAGEPEAYVYLAHVVGTLGRRDEALGLLEAGAARGIASAQIQLANELADTDLDDPRVEELYRLAMEQGDQEARTNLGIHLLELGRREEAFEHLRATADAGDELARNALADEAPPAGA